MFYKAELAEHKIIYEFRDKRTAGFFSGVIPCYEYVEKPLKISEEYIQDYIKETHTSSAYAEHMGLLLRTSNELLKYDCCAFHAVAIRVNGKGYLISADSGVGKTTQYKNLKKLYGDEIEIINGDKPFLCFKNNEIIIYPSFWRGKEDYGSNINCRLCGLIFLVQDGKNLIFKENPENNVVRSLGKFIYYPDSENVIRKVCELDRKLLKSIPIWQFKNLGDLDSSQMLYETVLSGEHIYE